MAYTIAFFEKSKCDRSDPNVSVTASQGDDVAEFPLNRSNDLSWITTGSVDADNTTWEVDMQDFKNITEIFLVKMNFKNYTIQYYDGSTYQNFSPSISVTNNTLETKRHSFTSVDATKIKITITGTMTANEDKFMYQFIATNLIGQLAGWPVIKNPRHSRNLKQNKMLSGKVNVVENVGAFSVELNVKELKSDADLTIAEALFASSEGFLIWLSGGSETQFSSVRKGYRLEDFFLMKCINDYEPEFVDGGYYRGVDFKMRLIEVVD